MRKVFIPTAIIASLVSASATALAAGEPAGVPTLSASSAAVPAAATANHDSKGKVEYAKKTLFHPDGRVAAINETWSDPVSHDQRLDYTEPAAGTYSMQRIGGAYVLNNSSTYIKVGSNTEGNLVGYKLTTAKPNQNWSDLLVAENQDYINEYKEGTRRAGWTDEGTVQSADGQYLRKLSRTDKSEAFKSSYMESVLLDDNGLPVQGEIYEVSNGAQNLLYTYEYEFKNISNDRGLFDTAGIQIEEIK